MKNIVKILNIKQVTHDVKCFQVEKPNDFHFTPGQATDVSINKPGWKEEKRPFTFTCLNQDPYLEFTIKRYQDHHGVTEKLHHLKVGDEIIIRDVWGAIEYKEPGYFIAGGAGITPFIAILRALDKEGKTKGNTLFFSNKTADDIIYETELKKILGNQSVFMLTNENRKGYDNGQINEAYIKERVSDFSRQFYICGPDKMVLEIKKILKKLGAHTDTVIFEK